MTDLKRLSAENLADIAEAFKGKAYALHPVMAGTLWGAGIAVANVSGYSPVSVNLCRIEQGPDAYEVISNYLDIVNRDLGLDDLGAAKIIASTMHGDL